MGEIKIFKNFMSFFRIYANDLHWLEGSDEKEDLCLHGHKFEKSS